MWNRGHGKVQAQTLLSRRIRPARGAFDVTYLATLPNMVVMAAADEAELVHMTYTAAEYDDGQIAFRYPRGNGTGVALPAVPEKLENGKGRVVRQGKNVAIFPLGTRLAEALKAPATLEGRGLSTSVIDQIGRANV